MNGFTDKHILEELKSGNSNCFEYLFFRHYSELCRYADCMIKNKTEAEEIVQETFLKLWERRNDIHIDISIKSYLYKSVHNKCINYFDHLKVHDRFSQKLLSESKQLIAPVGNDYPIAHLILNEMDSQIQKAIAELPQQCREVFIKIRHEELSYSETADTLGLSVNTVKTQLQRAMLKLREALKEYLPK